MTTKNVLGMMAVMFASVALVGCAGSVQVVRRGSFSGELAMSGNVPARMDMAQAEIMEHCEGRYRIASEEEASLMAAVDPGIAKQGAEAVTIDGERLHYVCVTRAAAAR